MNYFFQLFRNSNDVRILIQGENLVPIIFVMFGGF